MARAMPTFLAEIRIGFTRANSARQRATERIATGWLRMPWLLRHGLVLLIGLGLLYERRPSTLDRPEFLAEDGQIFFLGTYFGNPLMTIFRPYQGYIHLIPRLIALLERAVPVASAPLVGNLAALLVVAAIAAYISSNRLADLVPSQIGRWLIAFLLIVVPGSFESLGSSTYIQWYLAVYLIIAAMARRPSSRFEKIGDAVTLVVAALTGPFGLLVAPLYVARFIRDRDRPAAWRAAAVVVPALLQAVVLIASPRAPAIAWVNPVDVLTVIGLRAVILPLVGTNEVSTLTADGYSLAFAAVAATLAAEALLLMALWLPNRRWALTLLYGFGVSLAASLKGSTDDLSNLLSASSSQRYFLIPGIMIVLLLGSALVSLRSWRWFVAASLSAVLVCGIVNDFALRPWGYLDWQHNSACIGGPTPCVVPVAPPGVWSIRWPGPGGPYEQTHSPP